LQKNCSLKLKLLFFFLIFQSSFGASSGPEEDYTVLYDLTNDWYVYSQKQESYTPYIQGVSESNPALTAFVNTKKFKHFDLTIKTLAPDSYIFINGKFYANLEQGKWLIIPIKNIEKLGENLAVTFYGSIEPSTKEMFIGSLMNKTIVTPTGIVRDNLLKMKARAAIPHANGFIILFGLLILFATVLVFINPKAFNEYYHFKDIFVVKIREARYIISKPLNQSNLVFLGLLAFNLAIFYLLLASRGVHLFQKQILSLGVENDISFITLFIRALVIAYAIYIFKYIFLNITSNLFGLNKTVNIHFFKIIQFNLFFISFIVFIFYAIMLSYNTLDNFRPILFATSAILLSLRTFLVFLTILKSSDIQSHYLFAYLCVVEILPIFIGIRFAF
jgi:hypothetical protein